MWHGCAAVVARLYGGAPEKIHGIHGGVAVRHLHPRVRIRAAAAVPEQNSVRQCRCTSSLSRQAVPCAVRQWLLSSQAIASLLVVQSIASFLAVWRVRSCVQDLFGEECSPASHLNYFPIPWWQQPLGGSISTSICTQHCITTASTLHQHCTRHASGNGINQRNQHQHPQWSIRGAKHEH